MANQNKNVKTVARKFYMSIMYIVLLAILLLCMVLLLTFLANPAKMIETIKAVFGLK